MERGLDLFFRPKRSEPEDDLFPMGVRSTALPDGQVIKHEELNPYNSLMNAREIVKEYQKVQHYNNI